MYDYDLAFIVEDDSVAYLKLAADKLKALLAFIENKKTNKMSVIPPKWNDVKNMSNKKLADERNKFYIEIVKTKMIE